MSAGASARSRFDALFPQQTNLILVVIDGATPELAEAAAASLSAKLAADPKLFPSVRRPDGGDFFNHNGLLFLPLPEVQQTMQQLFKAQPFLGAHGGRSLPARRDGQPGHRAAGREQRPGQAGRSGRADGAVRRQPGGGGAGADANICPGAR